MDVFSKTRSGAPAGFFEVEAAGLAWLADAHAVAVPEVLDVGPGFIELERIAPGTPTAAVAERFGRDLARLHDAGAPAFGAGPECWGGDGYIGDAPLPLPAEASWGRFYARWRIEPYLAASGIDNSGLRTLERLAEGIEAGSSTTTPRPPGSTATCGRATSCSLGAASCSSIPPPTAATASPTWRCSPCSEAPSWP